jgi:hypothetical protein
MIRLFGVLFFSMVMLVGLSTPAQASATKDTQAVAVASKALQALTGGTAITDAKLQATASYIAGSDEESGTGTLEAATGYESRLVLTLSGGRRVAVRNGYTPSAKAPMIRHNPPR